MKAPERTGCDSCLRAASAKAHTKHGFASNWTKGGPKRLYTTWLSMLQRCRNPKAKKYPLYGGRGIRVCQEWLTFEGFRAWAEANGYADDLTIERVNPNWHYDPTNCEWITREVNSSRSKRPGHYWRSMTCNA